MEEKTKKQHFVPRFYLKAWCRPNTNQIQIYDVKTDVTRPANVEDVASERYFYDIELTDLFTEETINELTSQGKIKADRAQAVEKALSSIVEAPFSLILNDILSRVMKATPWIVNNCVFIHPQERIEFAKYLAIQMIRTKEVRQDIIHSSERIVQKLKSMGVPDETAEKYAVTKKGARRIQNRMLMNDTQLLKAAGMFNSLTWVLGINRTGKKFYTSDNPIGRRGHKKSVPKFISNVGLNSPGVEVFFPLSPDVILIMSDGRYHTHMLEKENRYVEINKEPIVDYYNSILVMQAERSVISCDGDFALVDELKERNPNVFEIKRD